MMATRTRGRYHCVVCSEECDRRAVRCGDCGRMTHIDCVRFCEYVLDVRPIDFVCRTCVYNGDDYDWEKALIRLVCIYYETLYGYVTVMWTASSPENTEPNHFVLLVPYRHASPQAYLTLALSHLQSLSSAQPITRKMTSQTLHLRQPVTYTARRWKRLRMSRRKR